MHISAAIHTGPYECSPAFLVCIIQNWLPTRPSCP